MRRLEHRGIRIVGVADGYDSTSGQSRFMLRGMRGIVNEVYLPRPAAQDSPRPRRADRARLPCRRNERTAIERARRDEHHGDADGFRLEIVAGSGRGRAGDLSRAIRPGRVCSALSPTSTSGACQDRVASETSRAPGRSRRFYGTPKDGSGLLNNELYIGRYVWNRREWVKDPDNPTRGSPRMRPREEWTDRGTTGSADRRRRTLASSTHAHAIAPASRSGQRGRSPPMRTLFGGLLRCASAAGRWSRCKSTTTDAPPTRIADPPFVPAPSRHAVKPTLDSWRSCRRRCWHPRRSPRSRNACDRCSANCTTRRGTLRPHVPLESVS